jgi:hypothetical protein
MKDPHEAAGLLVALADGGDKLVVHDPHVLSASTSAILLSTVLPDTESVASGFAKIANSCRAHRQSLAPGLWPTDCTYAANTPEVHSP